MEIIKQIYYYIEDDKLIITKGKEGLKVDTESLIQKIKEILENINLNQEYIEIPVINKIPEKIDIEKKVNRYSKDAEPEILKLAKKLAKFNNENIDLLKKYL